MEKQKFEESWKEAFQRAEVSPSESLWTNIELDLEKATGGEIRRRLLFFKWAAAASIVFAFGMGGLYYFNQQNIPADKLTLHNEPVQSNHGIVSNTVPQGSSEKKATETDQATELASIKPPPEESTATASADHDLALRAVKRNNSVKSGGISKDIAQSNRISSLPVGSEDANDLPTRFNQGTKTLDARSLDQFSLNEKKLPPLIIIQKIEPNFPSIEPDPLILLLARLDEEKKVEKKKNDVWSEKLWTSVGFAAGSFNTMTTGGPVLQQSVNSPSANNASMSAINSQTKASGVSYSAGFNVGGRLSKHWVLQGGFSYLEQSSDYTANTVISSADLKSFRAATVSEFYNLSAADAQPRFTTPYNVNNSLQFVNLPLQAGYLVVNHNLGVQLNAGVSTDFFLRNTITPQSESLNKVTQDSGSESPYRTVNFSGLFGTELSYRFKEHYRVALNPGLRYPLNSIYKSEVGVSATPLTFDIGLRLRYIFQ